MARITIVGDALTVTSSKKLEDLKLLEEYRPKALRLTEANADGKQEEIFRVSTTTGKGSINQYGASFASATHDDAKLATITMEIPAGTEDAVEYAAKRYGLAVLLLNRVEAGVDAALEDIKSEMRDIRANITVA